MGLERINYYKKEKGLTNKKISELTGISISSLDKITSGENTNPKLETIRLICQALGCSMNDLLDNDLQSGEELSSNEQELIKKYRALDEHGKRIVDFVANEEYNRIFPSEKSTTIYRAAKSSDNHPAEIIETTKDFSKIPPTKRKL